MVKFDLYWSNSTVEYDIVPQIQLRIRSLNATFLVEFRIIFIRFQKSSELSWREATLANDINTVACEESFTSNTVISKMVISNLETRFWVTIASPITCPQPTPHTPHLFFFWGGGGPGRPQGFFSSRQILRKSFSRFEKSVFVSNDFFGCLLQIYNISVQGFSVSKQGSIKQLSKTEN